MYRCKNKFRDRVLKTRNLTHKPFGVNFNLFPAVCSIDYDDYLDVIDEMGIKVIETSGHKASKALVPHLKDNNRICIHKCVGLRYAKKAASLGADMITVVGYENGGATGVLDIGTFVLISRAEEELRVSVVGGGLVAVLALGAEGVIIGTIFLLADECPIDSNLKNALLKAEETDTVLVMQAWETSTGSGRIRLQTRCWSLRPGILLETKSFKKPKVPGTKRCSLRVTLKWAQSPSDRSLASFTMLSR